jgi:hypothetical protein
MLFDDHGDSSAFQNPAVHERLCDCFGRGTPSAASRRCIAVSGIEGSLYLDGQSGTVHQHLPDVDRVGSALPQEADGPVQPEGLGESTTNPLHSFYTSAGPSNGLPVNL